MCKGERQGLLDSPIGRRAWPAGRQLVSNEAGGDTGDGIGSGHLIGPQYAYESAAKRSNDVPARLAGDERIRTRCNRRNEHTEGFGIKMMQEQRGYR